MAEFDLESLRARVRRMEGSSTGRSTPVLPTLPTLPALSGLVELRPGAAYEVDSACLALALLAGASRQGAWSSVIGATDLGWEAAAAMGVDLGRTVLVPDPRHRWLEATAALIEVTSVVMLRPSARVAARDATRLGARLRNKQTTLVVWGSWPGSAARLSLRAPQWSGLERGAGRLHTRTAELVVGKGAGNGSGPSRRMELMLAADGTLVRQVAEVEVRSAPVVGDSRVAV